MWMWIGASDLLNVMPRLSETKMVPDSPSFRTESPRPRVTLHTALLFFLVHMVCVVRMRSCLQYVFNHG